MTVTLAELSSSPGSIYSQAVERRTSRATSNIGSDCHFEDGDIREFDAVFFDLGCGMRWTEIPLVAHDLSHGAFRIRRPSQRKFLRATRFFFLKYERDAFKVLWSIKD